MKNIWNSLRSKFLLDKVSTIEVNSQKWYNFLNVHHVVEFSTQLQTLQF